MADPNIAILKRMFPDVDPEICEAVLQANNGNLNSTISSLLEISSPSHKGQDQVVTDKPTHPVATSEAAAHSQHSDAEPATYPACADPADDRRRSTSPLARAVTFSAFGSSPYLNDNERPGSAMSNPIQRDEPAGAVWATPSTDHAAGPFSPVDTTGRTTVSSAPIPAVVTTNPYPTSPVDGNHAHLATDTTPAEPRTSYTAAAPTLPADGDAAGIIDTSQDEQIARDLELALRLEDEEREAFEELNRRAEQVRNQPSQAPPHLPNRPNDGRNPRASYYDPNGHYQQRPVEPNAGGDRRRYGDYEDETDFVAKMNTFAETTKVKMQGFFSQMSKKFNEVVNHDSTAEYQSPSATPLYNPQTVPSSSQGRHGSNGDPTNHLRRANTHSSGHRRIIQEEEEEVDLYGPPPPTLPRRGTGTGDRTTSFLLDNDLPSGPAPQLPPRPTDFRISSDSSRSNDHSPAVTPARPATMPSPPVPAGLSSTSPVLIVPAAPPVPSTLPTTTTSHAGDNSHRYPTTHEASPTLPGTAADWSNHTSPHVNQTTTFSPSTSAPARNSNSEFTEVDFHTSPAALRQSPGATGGDTTAAAFKANALSTSPTSNSAETDWNMIDAEEQQRSNEGHSKAL
ncbi:hypothetical protein IWQ60_006412 [Tieghemiomyces parasiticus]|uniref:CUE domain-containing protein n=1 Tax=Tieghemiomyces parasiticus TaxID=78921 RepID=A0A9W8A7A9_9FUNG|nr:hypothetical protein IWQ60_006412 [Tieghemiomyces parasiticus]